MNEPATAPNAEQRHTRSAHLTRLATLPGRATTAMSPRWVGLAACAVAVAIALMINQLLPAISPLTVAVVLGAILGNTILTNPGPKSAAAVLTPGLKFAAKRLLRAGIVILGLRLAIGDVLSLGARGLGMVVVIVTITFVGTQLLGRALGVSRGTGLLVATGFSICGASAVAAMDGVTKNKEEEVVTAIALVTMCGTMAIAILPLLQHPLGLGDAAFGSWVGASVHDVAQVVATASVVGPVALAPAVIVKLTRVVLLAPLVAGMSLYQRRQATKAATASYPDSGANSEPELSNEPGMTPPPGEPRSTRATQAPGHAPGRATRPPIVPLFVLGFLAMVVVRSTGILPGGVLGAAHWAETILLAAALFGLGSAVHLKTLFRTGGRAALLGLCSWVIIAALAYVGVLLVGA